MIKNLLIIILFCACIALGVMLLACQGMAQTPQIGGGLVTGGSKGDGNGWAIGGFAEVAAEVVRGRVTAVGLVEYQHSPKQYVGDGTVFRARPEARYYLLKDADWRPFIGGGVSFVKVWTSQYSKHGLNPMITAGINYKNIFIARGAYLFRDRTPLPGETRGNDISGFRVGFDFWQPVSEKWLFYFGHEITNYGFTQLPGYPNEGRHRATAFAFRIGAARRIGE